MKNPLTNTNYYFTKGFHQCVIRQVLETLERLYPVLIGMPVKSERLFCRHLIVVLWNYEVLCAVRKLCGLPPPEPLRLPKWFLVRLAGYMSSPSKFSAKAYLLLFQVFVMPQFQCNPYIRPTKQQEGQVRTLRCSDFAPEILHLAKNEARKMLSPTYYVWRDLALVGTGKCLTKKNIIQFLKSENQRAINNCKKRLGKLQAQQARNTTVVKELQEKILATEIQLEMLQYHNCAEHYGILSRWIRKNKHFFIDMYEYLRYEYFAERKNCTDTRVNYFFETTDGFYNILLPFACSGYRVGGKSARLKSIFYPHLSNCPRRLRKALFKGCYSADLACIQLAIMASFFKQTGLNKLLAAQKAQRKKIWVWLEQQLPQNIVKKIIDKGELKSAIKAAVYVVVFGGGEKTVLHKAFIKNLPTMNFDDCLLLRDSFLQIPEIDSLWQARNICLEDRAYEIMAISRNKKNARQLLDLHAARKVARSELACIAQGFEQRAMGAIYREAIQERQKKRPRFHILLNLFDGVIFSVNDPKSLLGIKKRLSNAIDKILDDLSQNPLTKLSSTSQYNSTTAFKINSFLEIEPV